MGTEEKTTTKKHRLSRADAEENRLKLLTAAHEVFLERGIDASLEEIARRASVGIGTLYRHFPTRADLIAVASDEQLATVARKEGELDGLDSPLDALHLFLKDLVKRTNLYRGLAAAIDVVLHSNSPGCRAATALGKKLLIRAQEAHEARGDVRFEDLVAFVSAISAGSQTSRQDSARINRMLEMIIQGLKRAR